MIEMGAVNEVKRFLKLKVRKDKSVNKAIRYPRDKRISGKKKRYV
jgi:tRNA dimethylallyltransferase